MLNYERDEISDDMSDNMRVLILDDPIENLSTISDYIASDTIEVVRVWETTEARKLFDSKDFNAVFVSAISLLPNEIGLCREYKKKNGNKVMLILFTPYHISKEDEKFLKEVCFDHILTSIDEEKMNEIREKLLSGLVTNETQMDEDFDQNHLMNIWREINEEALRDLAAKARKLEDILENATDVIYELDPYGKIVLISKSIEKLTGYDRNELIGMSALEMTSADSVELVGDHLSRLISGHEEPIAVEVGVQAKDGKVIPAEMIVRPVWHKDEMVGILGIGRNVEDRKRLEQSLKSAISEKEFYLDLMAHDIQNFNQAIMGYLEMIISTKNLDNGLARYAHGAFRQVTQIANLIAHIRRVAQIRQTSIERMIQMDLRQVLLDSIMKLQSRIDKNLVAITFECDEGEYPIVSGEDIRDLLDLLVSSALRYSISDLLHLRLTVSPEFSNGKKLWAIEMTGNNLRLSEPIIRCVMSPDYSGCQVMERPDLQLLVARAIVETLGGKLTIKSAINGRGDGFVIRIPQAK